MMRSHIAVDTNILVYLFDEVNDNKRHIAEEIVADTPCISSQVISEFINTSKRLLSLPKIELLQKCSRVTANCTVVPVTQNTLVRVCELIKKHDFQLFDSIVVTAALEANCTILYTEDMHHNLLVEKQLRIVNPFL